MKKFLASALLVMLISSVSWCQVSYTQDIQEITLIKGSENKGISLGSTTDQALKHLGQPSVKENFYFEMDEKEGKLYRYGKNELYFIENRLNSFLIYDESITVSIKHKRHVRINDNLEKPSKQNRETTFLGFPVSPVPGNAFNKNYKTALILLLTFNDQDLDSSLSFLFDERDKLNCIALHNN